MLPRSGPRGPKQGSDSGDARVRDSDLDLDFQPLCSPQLKKNVNPSLPFVARGPDPASLKVSVRNSRRVSSTRNWWPLLFIFRLTNVTCLRPFPSPALLSRSLVHPIFKLSRATKCQMIPCFPVKPQADKLHLYCSDNDLAGTKEAASLSSTSQRPLLRLNNILTCKQDCLEDSMQTIRHSKQKRLSFHGRPH